MRMKREEGRGGSLVGLRQTYKLKLKSADR